MNQRPENRPYFLFLLPVFFVLHGFLAHLRFIRIADCLPLTATYLLAALVPYLVIRRLLNSGTKAALIVFLLLSFYLFFGDVRDLFRRAGILLYHYSVLLPVYGIAMILLTRWIIRHPPAFRLTRFLNVLFILFILADGIGWAIRSAGADTPAISASAPRFANPCKSCPHPDIYLLLFDEYAGSKTLMRTFHYDNSALDSFLRGENFHILPDSRSNYSATPFSMASMLNLAYLNGIRHPRALEPEDYANIFVPLENNETVRFLSEQGYSIVNLSPFDMAGHPAKTHLPVFPSGSALITWRNLPDCMIRDFPAFTPSRNEAFARIDRMNETELTGTLQISARNDGGPKFVYTHVMMPHEPFLFDSLLHRRDIRTIRSPIPNLKDYLGYLPYTNMRIRQLITTIKKNTGGKAVILFLSDHGFRYWPGNVPDSVYFSNQNAVYLPDGDYSGFYDSISSVNQFRVVFNKLFRLDLPLLRDSTVLLLDKTN